MALVLVQRLGAEIASEGSCDQGDGRQRVMGLAALEGLYLIAACLTGLASIQQKPHHAAQMLAASRATFERSSRFIEPLYRVEHEHTESRIREVLNAQDFTKFSEEGHAMTVEQAITFTLETAE